MLVCPPGESSSGRVIGGKPCVAYGQCEKRDQAAAISIGHHAAVRAMVHRLPVESAQSRRDDARARPVRRSFHDSRFCRVKRRPSEIKGAHLFGKAKEPR
jgi:hypothetical protein